MRFHISSSMNGFEGYNDLFYREYYSQNRQKPCHLDRNERNIRKSSIEYKAFQTRYAGHATDLARKISSLPEDRIYLITVGGDGTLNEVINGITEFFTHCTGYSSYWFRQ